MKLTETRIRHVEPTDKDQWLNDGRGLYLRVRRGGSKVWVIRHKRAGKTNIITLENYPAMPLKAARLKAAEYQLKQNVSNVTVGELVTKYLAEIVEPSHRRPELVQGYMGRAILPALKHRKARDVTRVELVSIVQAYSKRGARSADQLRSQLHALFSYGAELGYCENNPMIGVSRRVTGYEAKPRERKLYDNEIRLIWNERNHNARILRFLLLTGLRISEAQKGHRKGTRWVVPAEVSKNQREHWVHLTKSAAAQLPFPKSTPTNIQAWLRRWCDNKGIDPRFTPHDMRRTFVTRLNDLGEAPFVVERMVNHTMQGVMAVYNRAEYEDERVEAAQKLEDHILEVVRS